MSIFGRNYEVEAHDQQMPRGFFVDKLDQKRETKKGFVKSTFSEKKKKKATK